MHKKMIAGAPMVAVLLATVFLGACDSADGQQPDAGAQAAPVSVVKVQQEAVLQSERLPGRTAAYKVAEIRPQVSGVITARSFTEGARVDKGQQLYQIDPALYRATYDSALADLQRARANVKSVESRERRYAELVEINAVSKQEYDDIQASLAQAKADVAVAQANVTTAKVNLDYTRVYSPISGRAGKSAVTEGALVTANQAEVLTRVTQLDPIYVDMTQSSTELMRMRNQVGDEGGIRVMLQLENGEEYAHEGELQFSDVTVDETTGSVQLRALFPNPDGVLLPGLFVQAQVILGEEQALLVPQKAATRDKDGQLSVWVMGADNTVNPAPITAPRAYQDKWIVTQGLKEGDVVVTEGLQKMAPGAAVNPTDTSAQAEQQNIAEAGEEAADADMQSAMPAAPPAAAEGDDAEQETQE